jgi:hypothetical protein
MSTDGTVNTWIASKHLAAETGKTKWVRIESERAISKYKRFFPENADLFPEPIWPTEPPRELIKIGFADTVINEEDHPIVDVAIDFEFNNVAHNGDRPDIGGRPIPLCMCAIEWSHPRVKRFTRCFTESPCAAACSATVSEFQERFSCSI